jgi:nicotinamidase-related amidase
MTLTALDDRTALVLIDLQYGITWMLGRDAVVGTLTQASRLADAFRRHGLPVVLVRVDFSADGGDRPANRVTLQRPSGTPPPNWAHIVDELTGPGTDIIVTKRQTGAFYGTDLDLQLRRRGMTGVVLGGIMTSMGVESTARAAYDLGYNLTFAADAMTDPNPGAHRHSLETIFPAIGEVDTTDNIIAALTAREQMRLEYASAAT